MLLTQSEHTAKQGWICHSVQATEEKERLNGQFRRDGLYTVQSQSFVLTTGKNPDIPKRSSSLLSAGFLVNPDIDGVDKPACRDREAALHPPQGESSSQIEDTSGAVHSDEVSAFCREVAALRLLLNELHNETRPRKPKHPKGRLKNRARQPP